VEGGGGLWDPGSLLILVDANMRLCNPTTPCNLSGHRMERQEGNLKRFFT